MIIFLFKKRNNFSFSRFSPSRRIDLAPIVSAKKSNGPRLHIENVKISCPLTRSRLNLLNAHQNEQVGVRLSRTSARKNSVITPHQSSCNWPWVVVAAAVVVGPHPQLTYSNSYTFWQIREWMKGNVTHAVEIKKKKTNGRGMRSKRGRSGRQVRPFTSDAVSLVYSFFWSWRLGPESALGSAPFHCIIGRLTCGKWQSARATEPTCDCLFYGSHLGATVQVTYVIEFYYGGSVLLQ